MIQVEIDSGSGFCFGVTTAIKKAEEELSLGVPTTPAPSSGEGGTPCRTMQFPSSGEEGTPCRIMQFPSSGEEGLGVVAAEKPTLYCLGDIVHNGMEVERLARRGLVTINHDQLAQLHDAKVLLRAHGEPPSTYELARQNNITLIDATCPVVLQLQRRIRKNYELRMTNAEAADHRNSEFGIRNSQNDKAADHHNSEFGIRNSQIVIFGKNGHAEVLGLVGQTDGAAIVVENLDDVRRLDFTRDIYLYSQTTKSLDEFHAIVDYIQLHIAPTATFRSFDTICRQVANRMPAIATFAARHDLILFVSGRKSSNGRVLFNQCLRQNPRSHHIESPAEIDPQWLSGISTVGICGATSTPKWLMEQCRDRILTICREGSAR